MRNVLQADEKVRVYLSILEKEGITKWSDVKELDAKDLVELGLNLMAKKRLLSLAKHHASDNDDVLKKNTRSANMWRHIMFGEGADLYFVSDKEEEVATLREGAEILQILKIVRGIVNRT